MSRPVGIGTALFAGTMFAALVIGDGFATGVVRGAVAGAIGFAVAFLLETRRTDDDD